jgi:hypothetical protein
MSSTPRLRSTCSVGAATENGTLKTVSSRFIAVTVTASLRTGCNRKSVPLAAVAAASTVCVIDLNPGNEAVTSYAPGGTVRE